MKKNITSNFKISTKLWTLLLIVLFASVGCYRALAGMPLYPQGVLYYSDNGVQMMGDSSTPNSFVQGIAYRSNVAGQSMLDPRVSFNVADPGVPMPAWYGWDVGSSAWTTSPMVGDQAMTVFQTRNGQLGWTGVSWVAGVKRVLTQNDITTNTINNNSVVMEPIPTPLIDSANTSVSQIGIKWTGLWDNDLGGPGGNANSSVVSYSLYRSENGGAYQAHGSPYAIIGQNSGTDVSYIDTNVNTGSTYKYKLTVNFEWNNHTPGYYETTAEGPESAIFVPMPPEPDRIVFLSNVQTITAGTTSNVITIETRDANGNTTAVKSDTTIDLTSNSTSSNKKFFQVSGGVCTSTQITQVVVLNGNDTAQFCYYDEIKSDPTWTLTAHKSLPDTSTWIDGTQAIIVNASSTIASVRIDSATNGTGSEIGDYSMTADQALGLFASGFDIYGNFVGNVSVTWSSSGFTPAVSGTGVNKTFSPTTAPSSGTISIDDGNGHTDSTGIITVNVGPAASFTVDAPLIATAGTTFNLTSITAKDADGNVATGYNGTKTLTFSGPGDGPESGIPLYSTSVDFSDGISTSIVSIVLYKAESTKITVNQAGIIGQSGAIDVVASSPTHLHVDAPATAIAGVQFNLTSIYAHDAYGNVATTYSGDKTLSYSGPSSTLLGNDPTYTTSVSFANGISTTLLKTTLYARETVAISVDDGTFLGSSGNISISAGASGSIEYFSGDNQTGTVKQNLPQPLVVLVKDIYGNVKDGQSINWVVTAGDGSFSLTTSITGANGTAQANWKIGSLVGSGYNFAEAQAAGLTGSPILFTATGIAGSASLFEIDAPTNATAGTQFTVTIKAIDSFGNVAVGFTGTKTLTYSDPGNGPISGSPIYQTSVEFIDGIATDVPVTLVKAETVSLSIQSGSYSGQSLPITVAPANAAAYEVVTPSSATVGQSFNLTSIKAIDQYGNYATNITGTKTLSYSGPGNSPSGEQPTYTKEVNFSSGIATITLATTLKKAENTSITVNDGTISGTSNQIAVTYADPYVLLYVSGSSQNGLPSATLPNPIVAFVADKNGNPATGKVVHFSPSAGSISSSDVTVGSDGLASVSWILGSSIGLQIVTASSVGISTTVLFNAQASTEVTPRLVITSIAQAVEIDAASDSITACLEDENGNNQIVSQDMTVNLSSTAATGSFALNQNGPWNQTTATINAGQSCTTFFYRDSASGVKTLTVSGNNVSSATQPIFVKSANDNNDSTTINNITNKIDKSSTENSKTINNYYTIEVNNFYYLGTQTANQATTKINVKSSPFPVITSPRDGSLIFASGGIFVSGTAEPNKTILVMANEKQLIGSATSDNNGIWQLYISAEKLNQETVKIIAKIYGDELASAEVAFTIKKDNSWQQKLIENLKKMFQ